MANEIKLGYYTGQTLTYAVYNPDGTEVTAPATSLPEIAATGYYTATNANIAAGDICIVSDTNGVLFQGEYKPEISATDIEAKIDIIDTNIDSVLVAQQQVTTDIDGSAETETKPRIYI